GDNEMSIAELRARVAENARTGTPSAPELFTIQERFSIPAACIVLALIGLALGITNRTDGTLGGFVMGFIVVMVYYILLWSSRAFGARVPPSPAPWIANIAFGIAGPVLIIWRARFADKSIRLSLPSWRRRPPIESAETARTAARPPKRRRAVVLVIRVPYFH